MESKPVSDWQTAPFGVDSSVGHTDQSPGAFRRITPGNPKRFHFNGMSRFPGFPFPRRRETGKRPSPVAWD
jgi:hypothetical protein